jgi:prepilin peptidase CpaA
MAILLVLAVILVAASISDIWTRRIPNGLIILGLAVGLAAQLWHGGGVGAEHALAGIGTALIALLPYALGALGAGDVKLLGVVGALSGPVFLLWTLLGTVLAGGLLALAWAARRGVLRQTVENALLGVPLLSARAGVSALAAHSVAGRMPFAPAITLGALFACWHLGLLP